MNKFIFLGNIATEIDTKNIGNTNVATFNVAVQRNYKNKDGKYESDFFRLTAFGNQAEFINKFFKKGDKILVEGSIENKSYEDQSGQKRYTTNYKVEKAYFANSKSDKKQDDFITIDDKELPF